MTNKKIYNSILKEAGLRVTPQRLAELETAYTLSHPTAEEITNAVKVVHPNISIATVYNVLETLVIENILHKVKTDGGAMVYDSIIENHHHIYIDNTNKIEDFYDDELDQLLMEYFAKKKLSGLSVKEIKLQIHAERTDNKSK